MADARPNPAQLSSEARDGSRRKGCGSRTVPLPPFTHPLQSAHMSHTCAWCGHQAPLTGSVCAKCGLSSAEVAARVRGLADEVRRARTSSGEAVSNENTNEVLGAARRRPTQPQIKATSAWILAVVIGAMLAYPPWQFALERSSMSRTIPGGYSWITHPPAAPNGYYSVRIDSQRLALQLGALIALAAAGIFSILATGGRDERNK